MTFQPPGGALLLFLAVAVILVPVQSVFEEVFFRGYILQELMQFLRNKAVLAILTGVIFALPHHANPEPWSYGIAPYVTAPIASGLFFGIVVLSDRGLELALAITRRVICSSARWPIPSPRGRQHIPRTY